MLVVLFEKIYYTFICLHLNIKKMVVLDNLSATTMIMTNNLLVSFLQVQTQLVSIVFNFYRHKNVYNLS